MKTIELFLIHLVIDTSLAGYWEDRKAILAKEASELLGSSVELTEKEQKVNNILMKFKLKEFDDGFANPSKCLPSLHFFQARATIEESEVFKIIKMLPKGASLHSHFTATVSFDFLFNLTYYEGLYGCDASGTFKLQFFFNGTNDKCAWKLLREWRKENSSFDDFLKSQLTLVVDDPAIVYDNVNTIWKKFEKIFNLIKPLLVYKPVLHDYIYQTMQEFYDDNVMYLEIRGAFTETFDSNGTIYDIDNTVNLYIDTMEEFTKNNPGFGGFRIIYNVFRRMASLTKHIDIFLKLQELYPELIAGFDLVGQEDLGKSLIDYMEPLQMLADKTNFFFHAGETNWHGASSDLNLIDAVLLNSTRIGHGFALPKHSEVLRIVKDRHIAIELNPISNQVLKLVDDLRNHPGSILIAGGYPVVITCDDPTLWGAKGLSYDFYLTFMGMVPRDGDIKVLKQLAINSLRYSSLDSLKKLHYLALFEDRWDTFLNKVLERYH